MNSTQIALVYLAKTAQANNDTEMLKFAFDEFNAGQRRMAKNPVGGSGLDLMRAGVQNNLAHPTTVSTGLNLMNAGVQSNTQAPAAKKYVAGDTEMPNIKSIQAQTNQAMGNKAGSNAPKATDAVKQYKVKGLNAGYKQKVEAMKNKPAGEVGSGTQKAVQEISEVQKPAVQVETKKPAKSSRFGTIAKNEIRSLRGKNKWLTGAAIAGGALGLGGLAYGATRPDASQNYGQRRYAGLDLYAYLSKQAGVLDTVKSGWQNYVKGTKEGFGNLRKAYKDYNNPLAHSDETARLAKSWENQLYKINPDKKRVSEVMMDPETTAHLQSSARSSLAQRVGDAATNKYVLGNVGAGALGLGAAGYGISKAFENEPTPQQKAAALDDYFLKRAIWDEGMQHMQNHHSTASDELLAHRRNLAKGGVDAFASKENKMLAWLAKNKRSLGISAGLLATVPLSVYGANTLYDNYVSPAITEMQNRQPSADSLPAPKVSALDLMKYYGLI